jgi:type II secretory pathway pseudopilin PulG
MKMNHQKNKIISSVFDNNRDNGRLFKMNNCRGQSLLEVIIAMTVFSLISLSIISLTLGSFEGLQKGGEETLAHGLAEEAIEAVRSVRDGAWNDLINNPAVAAISGGQWVLNGGVSELINGKFTRTILFNDVCRDGSGGIVACPGAYTDVQSKKVDVNVDWSPRPGITNTVQKTAYLTNWDSSDWTQTNWMGGSGQSLWSDTSRYDSDDGNIDNTASGELALKSQGSGCGVKSWHFLNGGDYTYNPAKIEVLASQAQLLGQDAGSCLGTPSACTTFVGQPTCEAQLGCAWGGGSSGVTLNPSFDADTLNWTFATWLNPGSTTVTGARVATGGNPAGYANISLRSTRGNRTMAGKWEQFFDTTVDAPDTATLNLDWRNVTYTSPIAPVTYKLYAFVDNFSGNPTLGTEVWSSAEIRSTTAWASIPAVDIAASIPTAGRYYLKFAAYATTPGSNNTYLYVSGFDNVHIDWSKADSCSGTPNACNTFGGQPACDAQGGCGWNITTTYPSDSPTVNPVVSYAVPSIDSWTSFQETATKNGGEIYYQLSDDDGATWQYWNGGAWAVAGAGNYNIASDVNVNIGTFNIAAKKIMFKAFLSGNGSQQVKLDEVKINCGQNSDWPFTIPSDYTYNPAKIEVLASQAQLLGQDAGSCLGTPSACTTFVGQPTCEAQLGCAWGGGSSGVTLNPSFDADTLNWTFATWLNPGSTTVTGARVATGGNPAGYANISLRSTRGNRTMAGKWEQFFDTTVDAPDTATLNLDWRNVTYTSPIAPVTYKLYAFVDNFSGNPTLGTEVWSSAEIRSTTAWASIPAVDIAASIPTAGRYYLKFAAYATTPGSNNTYLYVSGFDNVHIDWSKADSCSGTPNACNTFGGQPACDAQGGCGWNITTTYPSDSPTVNPVVSYAVPSIDSWTSFQETATKNGGEIYYQLSDDDGATWQYWNGGAWAVAGAGNYNIASDVNVNIGTFNIAAKKIMFKAFLSGNGSQQVKLDNLRVGWGEPITGSGYATSGYLVSSAYDTINVSPLQLVAWDENIASCPATCQIKLQVRAAMNSGGVPGAWTGWYGASGAGSYFTVPRGSLIPNVLNGYQWVQYRAELIGDGSNTPILQEVRVNYK